MSASTDESDTDSFAIRRRSIPDIISGKLLEKLESGSLPEGDFLSETELADLYEVSRSSVRTALQKLQHAGFVAVVRGRGWQVKSRPTRRSKLEYTNWSPEQYESSSEILEIRMALEPMAASLTAVRASQADIDQMRELHKAFESAPRGNIDAIVAADEAFHQAVVEGAGNAALTALYETLVPDIRRFRRNSYPSDHIQMESAEEHFIIVKSIEDRDSALARRSMMNHLWMLYDDVTRSGAQHPTSKLRRNESLSIFG